MGPRARCYTVGWIGWPWPGLIAEACGVQALPLRHPPTGPVGVGEGLVEEAFGAFLRGILIRAVEGRYSGLDELVVLTTGDAWRRAYAYLSEFRNTLGRLPPVYALDLVEPITPGGPRYNEVQVEGAIRRWGERTGTTLDGPSWASAGAALREWYQAWAALRELRRSGVLSGAEALRTCWAARCLPIARGAAAIRRVIAAIQGRKPRPAWRGVWVGSEPDAGSYRAVEAAGGLVVADEWEPDPGEAPGEIRSTSEAAAYLATCLPPTRKSPSARGERLRRLLREVPADTVIVAVRKGDYATGWAVPLLAEVGRASGRRVVILEFDNVVPDEAWVRRRLQARQPVNRRVSAPAAPVARPPEQRAGRRRVLEVSREAMAVQRASFEEVHQRAHAGGAVALVNADAPLELLRVLDTPFVVNQWWTALCAAKGLADRDLQRLQQRGYPEGLCAYCSVSLGSLERTNSTAPWGGLPRPRVVLVRETCDGQRGVSEALAATTGATVYMLPELFPAGAPVAWWEELPERWERWFGRARLDVLEEVLRAIVRDLERYSAVPFDEQRLAELLDRTNEQCEWFRRCCQLLAANRPAPALVSEWVAAVMVAQWHRGTPWAVSLARRLYEELAERVRGGSGTDPYEVVRVMWIGRGLWHDLGLYEELAERYGAVCVWSPHLPLAAEAYPRYGGPALRALASRSAAIEHCLHTPPWNVAWYVKEARRWGIDAAIYVHPEGCSMTSGAWFVRRALEAAGVSVLELHLGPVLRRGTAERDVVEHELRSFFKASRRQRWR